MGQKQALVPLAPALQGQHETFVQLVAEGFTPRAAASRAGFSDPDAVGRALICNRAIQAALHDEQRRLLATELVPMAYRELKAILNSKRSSDGAKVKAAVAIFNEAARANGQAAGPKERDPDSMTMAELEEYLASAKAELKTIEGTATVIPDDYLDLS